MRIAHDIAPCTFHTDIEPFTKLEVYIDKRFRDQKMQRALMEFSKPEYCFTVWNALIESGWQDMIGDSCNCLIPAYPPREAIDTRRGRANRSAVGDN
jgi:hypothetical protein